MGRKLRVSKGRRVVDLDPVQAYVFTHGRIPPREEREQYPGRQFDAYLTSHPSLVGTCHRYDKLLAPWQEHRDAFLEDWTRERPGTRPFAWWLIDAPREVFDDGEKSVGPEPLRHVGGSGRVIRVGVYPEATARACGCLPFEAIDPDDPPLVESEAAYLRRHGLLLTGERRRLTSDAFEPKAIVSDEGVTDDER